MKIELIENLSNDQYHSGIDFKEYWSSTSLKEYLNTPKEAFYQKYHAEKKKSAAMDFGSQLHDFLASKHYKGAPFNWNVFEEPVNPTTKEPYGKTTKAYQDALSKITNPISSQDYETIQDIWQMILNSKYAWFFKNEVLNQGYSEPSIFYDGLFKYQIRPDVLTDKYIFDYKTIDKRLWSENKLKSRVIEFGYDIQASMYQFFEHKRSGIWKPFIIIWIMKEPPYDILITDISEFCFESIGNNDFIANSGAKTFLKLKDQHELCMTLNNWPGIASQFDDLIPKLSPRFERSYESFQVENDEF